jgi:hypothetical protein
MKKSIITFAIGLMISAPGIIHAQTTFPLPELIKLTSLNPSDFETKMLEKDYTLQNKESTPTTKIYTSDKPGASGKPYRVSRHQVPHATVDLIFSTTDKKYYLELKSKLASSGYKFVKEENKPVNDVPAVWYHYTNGLYKVSIASYTSDVTWFTVQAHL